MAQPLSITWSIEADFDLDGTYEVDLTGRLERGMAAISIDRGINPDGTQRISQVQLQLENRDGEYTPENTSATLAGQLRPRVPIRIRATHNSITYTLWAGYIKEFVNEFRRGPQGSVRVRATDLADWLADYTPLYVNASTSRDTDGALVAIMDAIGFTAPDYTFDDGIQDLDLHFVAAQDAKNAVLDVVKSEMGGFFYVQSGGTFRFESRQSRLGISVDDTWGDGTNITPSEVRYEQNSRDLATIVTVIPTIYHTGQTQKPVLEFQRNMFTRPTADSISLVAGEVYTANIPLSGGLASAIVTPVSGTDYKANDSADGTGTDRTSSLTVVNATLNGGTIDLRLRNDHSGTIYITQFRIRGTPVNLANQRPQFVSGKSVTGWKADKGVTLNIPFADDTGNAAKDYSYSLLRTYRYPMPMLELSFLWGHDDIIVAMAGLELGDQILYKDTGLGNSSAQVDDWWYVERIKHSRIRAGDVVQTDVTLVPSYMYRNLDAVVYDLFTRANATGDLGVSTSRDTWSNDGNFDIVSNTARANSDTLQMPTQTVGAADQVVEVNLAAIGVGDEVGVVFRYTDANNQYRCYLDKGSNEVILEKNVATVVTEISSPAYTVGTAHELRVMIQGANPGRIRVWVDYVLVIDTTDSDLDTGNLAGLFARNANASTTFDDVYMQGL